MHRIHSPSSKHVPRSKLGATLLLLHRNLEGSHQREQAALRVFEEWKSRWVEHRDLIARRLASLDQMICNLSVTNTSTPQLLIVNTDDLEVEELEERVSVRINFPQRPDGLGL